LKIYQFVGLVSAICSFVVAAYLCFNRAGASESAAALPLPTSAPRFPPSLVFLISLRSLSALSVALTRFWGVSLDPDELSDDEEPDSDSEYEVSDESEKDSKPN